MTITLPWLKREGLKMLKGFRVSSFRVKESLHTKFGICGCRFWACISQ